MKIFLITSSRADFGILKNLIIEINKYKKFNLKIVATGSHFLKKHGYTFKEIKDSKIKLFKKIIIKSNSITPQNILEDISVIIKKMGKFINKDRPDLLIVLGDRYEIFASAIPFYFYNIPIAHIHGGEVTTGSLDDSLRHCLTKISNIHFVASNTYRRRVIQLGENPENVYNVGGIGIDNIFRTKLLSKDQLEKNLNISFKNKSLIINFQPELNKKLTKKLVIETLKALETHKDKTLIFTMPGSDLNKNIIFNLVKKFVKKNKNSYLFKSLGSTIFLSFLSLVDGMLGNSSSGLTEMPVFKKATINIGTRQSGRLVASSIINVIPEKKLILKALDKIYSNNFQKKLKKTKNLYGKGNSINQIIKILKKININKFKNKSFFDVKFLKSFPLHNVFR